MSGACLALRRAPSVGCARCRSRGFDGRAFARTSYNVRENAGSAQLKVRSKMDNVAGVQLPQFESYSEGADVFELTGLGRGGQQVQHCKKTYKNAVQLLTDLATFQVRGGGGCTNEAIGGLFVRWGLFA